jgi:hypothetical protein
MLLGEGPVLRLLKNVKFFLGSKYIVSGIHGGRGTYIVVVTPAVPSGDFYKPRKIDYIKIL